MNSDCSISCCISFPLFDLSSSFLFLKIHGIVSLCSWKNGNISIHRLKTDGSYSASKVLKINHPVIAILNVQDTVICVDSKGNIYKIVSNEDAEDQSKFERRDSNGSGSSSPILGTGNLREDSHQVDFKITQLDKLNDCEEALHVSYVQGTKQISILSHTVNKLFFMLYDFATMKVSNVIKIPYNMSEIVWRKCFVKSWHSRRINAKLKNVLFPSSQTVAFVEFSVFMIALSNGSVLWMTSNNFSRGFQLLHLCHQPVSAMEFITTGGEEALNTLCLVLEGGTVLLFSIADKKLSIKSQFLPGAAKAAIAKPDGSILSSDFTDCFYSSLGTSGKEICLNTTMISVKGVIKFTQTPDNDDFFILASTKQNSVYKISIKDIEPVKVNKNFLLPKQDLLKNLMATSNTLDNLLKQIQEEDERLAAISIATRADMLHTFFNVSVKVHSGPSSVKYGSVSISSNSHAFVIKIENKCDFYEFSPKLWHVSVSIVADLSMDKHFHRNIRLKQLFEYNNTITVFFPVILNLSLPDLSLKVNLISKQSHGNNIFPWLTIPLKTVAVNLLYFFTPLKNPALLNTQKSSCAIGKFLEKISFSNPTSSQMYEGPVLDNYQLFYPVKVPEHVMDSHNIFSLVLNYSKYRCKENVWNSITDTSKVICFASLSEKLIHFSLERSCLCLKTSGVEAQVFHSIKFAVINLLSSLSVNDSILMKKSQLLEVQASIQALEVSQISGNCDLTVLRDLQNNLRTSIVVNLPP